MTQSVSVLLRSFEDGLEKILFLSILSIVFFIPFSKGGISVSLGIGFGAFVLLAISRRRININAIPMALHLLLFLIAVEISMLFHPSLSLTFKGLLKVLKALAIYLVFIEGVKTEKRLLWLLRVFLIAGFLSCLNGLWQNYSGWDFFHFKKILLVNNVRRVTGSFNHPNNFAAYLAVIILIAFYVKDRMVWRWLWVAALPFLFYLLTLTYSRLPLILLLLILLFGAVISREHRRFSLYCLIVSIAVCATYFFFDPKYLNRLLEMKKGDGRLGYWIYSFDIIKENLLFGSGINRFMEVFWQHPYNQKFGINRFVYAHNFIIQMLVEIGVVGLAAFLNFLGGFFLHVRRSCSQISSRSLRWNISGLLAAIVFFLLHSCVDTDMQSLQLNTLFWVMIGAVAGVTRTQTTSF